MLRIRIRNPVPFCPLDPGSVMGKKLVSESGMNNPDHSSESLKTIFWVKILKFFDADPESGMGKNKDAGSGIEKIRMRDPG